AAVCRRARRGYHGVETEESVRTLLRVVVLWFDRGLLADCLQDAVADAELYCAPGNDRRLRHSGHLRHAEPSDRNRVSQLVFARHDFGRGVMRGWLPDHRSEFLQLR